MRVDYSLGTVAPLGPAVLTIGFFDGVHLGHRHLVARAAELARQHNARAVAVTFWPYPASVVRPETPFALLSPLPEKLALLDSLGQLDATIVMPFTTELAALDPDAFLDQLAAWCQPRVLVEGPDFAVGRARSGDLAFLRAAGERRGFRVESLEVREDGECVSSTRIRNLIRDGQLEPAAKLLGRPYRLTGEVVTGDRRGRLLGFPTANLRLDPRVLVPANGIYAVRVRLPGETDFPHLGVASIGVRPTFGGDLKPLVEIYLLDTTMDLYGLPLTVELVARQREERRFDSADALIEQMHRDVAIARELLAAPMREHTASPALPRGPDADMGATERREAPWA